MALLDLVTSAVLPGVGDAETAVVAVLGSMVVMAVAVMGLKNVYQLLVGFPDELADPTFRNEQSWGEVGDFLSGDEGRDRRSGAVIDGGDEPFVEAEAPEPMNNEQWQVEFASRPDIDLDELDFDAQFDDYAYSER